jgi:hypothetical protein
MDEKSEKLKLLENIISALQEKLYLEEEAADLEAFSEIQEKLAVRDYKTDNEKTDLEKDLKNLRIKIENRRTGKNSDALKEITPAGKKELMQEIKKLQEN